MAAKFCPECGSVAVTVRGHRATCSNCGHAANVKRFAAGAYTSRYAHWGSNAYGDHGVDPIRFERGSDPD